METVLFNIWLIEKKNVSLHFENEIVDINQTHNDIDRKKNRKYIN